MSFSSSSGVPHVADPEPTTLVVIRATAPSGMPPAWAVLERHLFDLLDVSWRRFEERYCDPDGRLRFEGTLVTRDGVDDFYEAFFNWPSLYFLGGASDLLDACKRHWTGVTAQLTGMGFLTNEYENGYDWFHQGESLLFFYAICAADPADGAFRERAKKFADLYLAGSPSGNFDAERNMIRAPHNGARGPLPGLGEDLNTYGTDLWYMEPYGLPVAGLPGIEKWRDLDDPQKAALMGQEIQRRLGTGDTAVNLCATSLMANAWLYDNESEYADWVQAYAGAWKTRAEELHGLMPDNVGPSGEVGELHDGRWYGGHYGWAWPHGIYSVGAAALIAAMNARLVGSDDSILELARIPLRQVQEQKRLGHVGEERGTMYREWTARLGDDAQNATMLVPYRHSVDGWFDYHPMQTAFPVWLWWTSRDAADLALLETLRSEAGYDWSAVHEFRDKEEAGHEAPWYSYLQGENADYPERALRMAIAQAARRLTLIAEDDSTPDQIDIHWWQRMNPVVTEVLTQLTTGAPHMLYNGGLQYARIRYADADAGRPGLPPDISALVGRIEDSLLGITLVNLSATQERNVVISGGAFGEDRFDTVTYSVLASDFPGSSTSFFSDPVDVALGSLEVNAGRFVVQLPPLTIIRLDCQMTLGAYTPRHQRFDAATRAT
ncbi:hypothetical protein [Nocardioides marmorisolisilvae]|uniref:Uncharacterized protein n=1 Tax=Nocardioides marmorisolisilvae TaxID=1542737 RepID=A0A3N0DPR1_9ACTN|nr:hypothetical protein [Nocardioides marmorisolisilvae]RNL77630.1 hypothetical protein EFL95_16615 [Nocardioides marmorisolisilvae]